uniref:Uncharacterized protein n=1 Tax=Meloidogyne incognita TaxID=6306 RepID=A0A914NGJ3_MELIC
MPLEKRRNALSFNNQLVNNNRILTKSYKEVNNIQKTNNILNDCPQSEEEFPTITQTSENFGLNFVGHFYSPNNFNYYNNSTPPFPLIHSTSVANLQKSLQTKNLINNQIPQSLKIYFPLFNSSIPSSSYQNLPSFSGFQIEEEALIEQKTRLFNYKQENYPHNQEKAIIEAILTSPQALVISGLLPKNILEDAQFWDQWLCQLSTSLNTTQWQKFWHQYASIFGFKALPRHLLQFFENFSLNEFREKEKVFEGNNNLLQLNCGQQQSTISDQLNGYIYGILCKYFNPH